MILFNEPHVAGRELEYIAEAIKNRQLSGDGPFTNKCHKWLEEQLNSSRTFLTTSCTHALEIAALISSIKDGDEVIMPSFTFTSTANAFVMRGAKIVFVDIKKDTMNIDENLIEAAITEKTKVIVPVHYAGVACEMDKILEIAKTYNLIVVEDAAQALLSYYKGKPLGSIGDYGCISFHESKNVNCGEGGCFVVNNGKYEQVEIIREKGTNRSKFFRGEIDKYTWTDLGSSYLPSEINAAFLFAQLEIAKDVKRKRLEKWFAYNDRLSELAKRGRIELTIIPEYCEHNAHIFFFKVKDAEEQKDLIEFLKINGVHAVFHYLPLHSSPMGRKCSEFRGQDVYTTVESGRIIRLPLNSEISFSEIDYIGTVLEKYYNLR